MSVLKSVWAAAVHSPAKVIVGTCFFATFPLNLVNVYTISEMKGNALPEAGQALRKKKSNPRYQDIEKWLRELVATGKPGEVIPSEVEIAAKFKVSRMTARQAVMNLMREGIVERRRGAGTFISQTPMHRREGILLSFTEDMKRRGLKPASQLISAGLETASAEAAKALKVKTNSKIVVISRIRYADGIPLAIERVSLIPECKSVLGEDLVTGSLHDALRKIGISPYVASGWLSARIANAKESKQLKLLSKTPLLVETRIIDDENGRPIEYTETAYAATRYVVDIRLNCAPAVIAPFNAAPIAPAKTPRNAG
jgi:GntR family transcriptional regulator